MALGVVLGGLFLFRVFSQVPFLQQEMLGQFAFWNHSTAAFTDILFDPSKNDAHPGRFRYVEYVSEGLYWKALRAGFLPQDLYDYFAISVVFGVFLGLGLFLRALGGPLWVALGVSGSFLLSAHAYLISVYHFRKAKPWVVMELLLLAFLAWSRQRRLGRDSIEWGIVVLGAFGFLTDPFFILLAPVFVLAWDGLSELSSGARRWGTTRSLALGYGLGLGGMLLLNGVIGPRFHPGTQLILWNFPDVPSTLLNWKNLPLFYDILPDLMTPLGLTLSTPGFFGALATLALGVGLMAWVIWKRRGRAPFIVAFVGALPVCSFLIQPSSEKPMFVGYYGLPLFLFYLLALAEMGRYFAHGKGAWVCGLFLLASGAFHQWSQKPSYDRWVSHHVATPATHAKYLKDYRLMREIKAFLNTPQPGREWKPMTVTLDYSRLGRSSFDAIYELGEDPTAKDHTFLAYLGIPLLFARDFEARRLLFVKQ